MEPHLDADTLAAYIDGRLAIDELRGADKHIDGCASCRVELSALAAVSTQPRGPDVEVPEGKLGRYDILREIGRGSMGIVLRAYDPELARPVALKLLRGVDADLLRREARALAKLRHGNVVSVYDVVIEDGTLYLAMELVDGDTLRAYSKGRSPREVIAACLAAGRGLAAAHDAGIVHRDFKPENVLCTASGEARVSDFGLARTGEEDGDGTLCGTPAYMAPEVLERDAATTASDQYSYCVSVYELLEGVRPVGDATPSRIPPWVWRVLRRGLARDPKDRFPSMHALVDALANDPAIRRRKVAWLGGGALAAIATGAALVQLVPQGKASCPVDVPHADIAAIAKVSDADIATHLGAALDDYAARWTAARQQACSTRDPVAASCLDRGRREFGELVKILDTADAATVSRAQEAVSRLRDPASCSTAIDVAPSSVAETAIGEQARVVLDRASTLQYVGKSEEAARLVAPLVSQLATQPRLLAEALLVQARIDNEHARPEQAESRLYDALHAAERGRDDMTVAAIWVEIVMATGAQSHRFDLAMANARAADAAIARVVAGTDLKARYDYTLGTMLLAHGKLDDARTRLDEGMRACGDEPRRQVQVGLFEVALCDVERQANKVAPAKQHCERGISLLEKALGRDHLRVGVSLSIVGALAFGQHDMTAAQAAYERAIRIFDKQKAPDHVANALVHANLGSVYASNGDVKRAQERFERSLALFEQYHPDHPQKQFALQGLAGIALRTGDYDNAVIYYRRVRDAMAKTYAPEHQSLLIADFNLALALAKHHADEAQQLVQDVAARALTPGKESWMIAARAFDEAAAIAEGRKDREESIALREKALAALDHADVPAERAIILRNIAMTLNRMQSFARALPRAEQSVELITKAPDDPYEVGVARFQLAVALDGTHRDPARALAMAEQAIDDLAKAQAGDQLHYYRDAAARFVKDHSR